MCHGTTERRQSGWFCYPAGLETAAAPRRVALSILGVPSKIVLARIPQATKSQVGGRCVSAPRLASEERKGPGSPAGEPEGARFGGGGWRL